VAEITFDRVGKVYPDGTVAVDALDLEIRDGELMVLVGPSGCGKTTALRMVAGLEEISQGEIRIGEQVVNAMPPRDRDVAMVFQTYALYPHKSVYDNLAFPLRLRRLPKHEVDNRVKHIAGLLELEEQLGRKPRQLSGGQRQRVAMGRAIVREPQAFLMDEPLSNLDAKLRVEMRAEIQRIQRGLAVTTIYVTHDQTEAMTMGDRVAVMRRGVLQQAAEPQRLYERPANLFVAEFIGSPAMNLVETEVVRDDDGLVARFGKHRLRLRRGRPGRAILGIRPEDLEDAALAGGAPDGASLTVVPEIREDVGAEVYVHFTLGVPAVRRTEVAEAKAPEEPAQAQLAARNSSPFVARLGRGTHAREGEPLTLAVDVERLYVFDAETGEGVYED